MAIHSVKIIESGHVSTVRLFELGLSFGICKRIGRWPCLEAMNEFLARGHDDGALATDISWEPCKLSKSEYEAAVASFMGGTQFTIDSAPPSWDAWVEGAR